MAERVIVNDVGPRDGLQNQQKILTPDERIRLVRALLAAGMTHIEVAAFVSPKAVPAMAGAAEVVAGLEDEDAEFSVLIPNMKGYELAVDAGARAVAMVLYGTDRMAEANVRMTMREAEEATEAIIDRARGDGVQVMATVSVAFECPFEGPVDPAVIQGIATRFLEAGADQLIVADTIGAANPGQVRAMMEEMVGRHGAERLGCHFHDTRAMGLANVYAALEAGVRRFDASIGGLGGCPFAPGASGNVATEDVVMMLHQMGFETGIDLVKLMDASRLATELTGTAPGGRAKIWLERYLAA
ncbi:MAG: hydroxymethylglutaryl-CoA lyase [Gammaproteobacteria bacterium]